MAITGKVALITGAASGIGRAVAIRLAADGAKVAIVDLAPADDVVAEITANGGTARGYRADVSNEEQVQKAVAQTETDLGTVQILINNAGLHPDPPTKIMDMSTALWHKTFAVDLDSMFFFTRAVLPAMTRSGWGRIVNLSSASVYAVTPPGGAHYVSAKAAAGGLATALAVEVADYGITANAIAPTTVRTPGALHLGGDAMLEAVLATQAIKRVMEPSDIAGVVSFLASDDAAMITGQVIHADAGSTRVN
ncbi:SDR family NAD(P)-dependent oxidoreductase [Mycetocola zhadangensis]|uniref:SDR family NAD(P)-dependent oxidoreductase n=1 Tax=Mycetocola zhadangensis TaxID=1164595 RepID=UPI003A4E4544